MRSEGERWEYIKFEERFYVVFWWGVQKWWACLLVKVEVLCLYMCVNCTNKFGWSEKKGGGNANFCGVVNLIEYIPYNVNQ